jgi:hypothetical protein
MKNLRLHDAKDFDIQPAKAKGMERHGICFFTWPDSAFVGGQCFFCNTIVWVDSRKNSVCLKLGQIPFHLVDVNIENIIKRN